MSVHKVLVDERSAASWILSQQNEEGMKMGEEEMGGNYLRADEVAEAPAGETE